MLSPSRFTSSAVSIVRKSNNSETGSVSVFRWGGDTCSVGSLRKSKPQSMHLVVSKEPNRQCMTLLSPEDVNRSSFRNVTVSSCLKFRTPGNVHKSSDSELQLISNTKLECLLSNYTYTLLGGRKLEFHLSGALLVSYISKTKTKKQVSKS
jgi:hypothetical protein